MEAMEALNERQERLIQLLVKESIPVPFEVLVDRLGASERTVKYDISKVRSVLETFGFDLYNKRGKGYYLNPIEKDSILKSLTLILGSDGEKQSVKDVLLHILLYNTTSPLKLSETLYMSESLIRQILRNFANDFVDSPLSLNLLLSEYSEKECRELFVKTIMNDVEFNHLNSFEYHDLPVSVRHVINKELYSNTKEVINRSRGNDRIWISNYAYIHLLLYLLILNIRIRLGCRIKDTSTNSYALFQEEYHFSKTLLNELIPGFVCDAEVKSMVDVLISSGAFVDVSESRTNPQFMSVIDKMIQHLDERYNQYRFNTSLLMNDLSLHLHQFLKKQQLGFNEEENPLLHQIKKEYQEYFEIAKELFKIFAMAFNIPMSESEMSYLAIYLYKNRIEDELKKYRVIAICATGRGLSKLLKKRIESVFSNIEIIDTVSSYHMLKGMSKRNIDFIISTVSLRNTTHDVVVISPFVTKQDIQKIQEYLSFGGVLSIVPKDDEWHHVSSRSTIHNLSLRNEITRQFSKVFLYFYDCLIELPSNYQVSQNTILGLTIHLIVALPRYVASETIDEDIELVRYVKEAERKTPEVAKVLNKFFTYLERALQIKLPYEERFAFYQYIYSEREL